MKLSIYKYFINYLFTKKMEWVITTIFLVISIVFIFNALNFNNNGFFTKRRVWDKWFDPGISLFTALVAIFIALQNTFRDWNESLTKRLTVHFVFGEKYIMTCHEAFLSSEGDIRQWGQQIGRQMDDDENLSFYPFITPIKKSKKFDSISKEVFKPYEVVFYLKAIPTKNNELRNKYLVWWDNSDRTAGNKAVYFNEQPKVAKTIDEAEAELNEQKTISTTTHSNDTYKS